MEKKEKASENTNLPKQLHSFYQCEVKGDTTISVAPDRMPTFPVKQVRINFAYRFKANNDVIFVVSSNIVDYEVVGVLNKYSYYSGIDTYTADGLSNDNQISFIFKEPRILTGAYDFVFKQKIAGVTISAGYVLVHLEFIGAD